MSCALRSSEGWQDLTVRTLTPYPQLPGGPCHATPSSHPGSPELTCSIGMGVTDPAAEGRTERAAAPHGEKKNTNIFTTHIYQSDCIRLEYDT